MPTLNFETTIDEIREMTDYNDSIGSYILGAELVGAELLQKKLKLLEQMRDLCGGLDDPMAKFKYALYQELMEFSTDVLTSEQQDIFYQSF